MNQLATMAGQITHIQQKLNQPPAPSRMPERALAVFNVLAAVLAVRLLLLLSLAGTFVLTLQAMAWQTPIGLAVAIAFALLTLTPLVWMEVRSRPPLPSVNPET